MLVRLRHDTGRVTPVTAPPGTDRLLYVEVTEWVSEYFFEQSRGAIGVMKQQHAGRLARVLRVEPVASGWRIMTADTDPSPWKARGNAR